MREQSSSSIRRTFLNVWAIPCCALAERWTSLITRLGLIILTSMLTFWEKSMAKSFEWTSRLLSIPPCGVYSARESAVVIIGGADDFGRAVALKFSELGYTVFVLCPVQLEKQSRPQSGKSTDVSSLLYLWHKRKEQSSHSWGLVAPISLDTESGIQRAHASDTVHAYCGNHSLNLVSLIVLPPPSPTSEGPSSGRRTDEGVAERTTGSPARPQWKQDVGHSMMEPVLVLEDYVDLLSKTSGRVIMLSTCAHDIRSTTCRPRGLLDGVQERVSSNLGHIMDPLGIRVCTLSVGPLEPAPDARNEVPSAVSHSRDLNVYWTVRYTIQELLSGATISTDVLCGVLQQILTARYPKYTYTLGVHPFLHKFWNALPDILRLPISFICKYLE